jgi:hypothetical protein
MINVRKTPDSQSGEQPATPRRLSAVFGDNFISKSSLRNMTEASSYVSR